MDIKIVPVGEGRQYFNALIYGDPGSGKTTLAASAQDHPELKDVLFANVEGGMLSISHRSDIRQVRVRETEAIEQLFWNLINDKTYKGFKTIVIDSATELQTLNLEELVQEGVDKAKRKGQVRSPDEIYQEDYGTSTNQLRRLFRWFKDAPVNVIVTALAKYVYPSTGRGVDLTQIEPLAVMPSLTAKLGKSVMGYMDFVWYAAYDPEADKFGLYTRSHGVIQAKTRGPRFQKALGPYVELNSKTMMLPQIYDLMKKTTTAREKSTTTAKKEQ